MFCLVLFVALLLLSLAFLRRSSSRQNELSLEWETGRRKARQPFKRPPEFYEYYGVTSSEDYFVNSRGVELFTKQWLPIDGRLRGVVFYCHGYGDTCAYAFEDVAIRLAAAGYAVESLDYEGFGLSAGLHGFIPRFDNLVDDVTDFTASLRARPSLAHLPFFLYGESMGGAVALLTHLRQPSSWQGAILAAPMCKIAPEMMPPKPVVTTLSFLASIFPRAKLVPTREIAEIGFRDPVKRAKLCENPVGYGGKPRLQTALQMLKATQRIGRDLDKVSVPFLLMHGAADAVTDPSVSEALFQQACSGDKTFRLYEECWHGLTTAEPDDVIARILDDMPIASSVLVTANMKRNPKRLKYAGGSRPANEVDVVTVDPSGSDASWKLRGIADLIKEGAVGLIPTDTVYALVCDVKNRDAIDRLYRIKQLDPKKPLSILCRNFQDIDTYTLGFPRGNGHGQTNIFRAARQCLPGPYTFILKASKAMPKQCTTFGGSAVAHCAPRKSVGVRMPLDPICHALLELLDDPLLCTSATKSSDDRWLLDPSVVGLTYRSEDGSEGVDFIVDGGARMPEPSTVVDMTGDRPVLLRRGQGEVEDWMLMEVHDSSETAAAALINPNGKINPYAVK
ncbi:unnamed protein product [Closterium sp. Yama58-4]|nr:unnamed protein product [Closterium sp. Yama58-4]